MVAGTLCSQGILMIGNTLELIQIYTTTLQITFTEIDLFINIEKGVKFIKWIALPNLCLLNTRFLQF